ncbi:c-type cytochrome [Photobacterium chitinilyticum]|uniref:Cytochrome c n=1 Tax=Photobacterium chitinilyticum TaxID=2485123 RepID=A0A444JSI5_9GAMM|nr:cytochrome c [Photobacterium chitinilyticum]RWX55938.1 cytochrome c [Photobacterium chitinilyticum]
MKKTLLSCLVLLPLVAKADDFNAEIQQRQEAFSSIETIVEQAESMIDGEDTDWEELSELSNKLSQNSTALFTLFPEGSQKDSKAKESVWKKSEKFNALLSQMDSGFEQLNRASREQNVDLAEAGLESAQGTCRSCHRSYRSRW